MKGPMLLLEPKFGARNPERLLTVGSGCSKYGVYKTGMPRNSIRAFLYERSCVVWSCVTVSALSCHNGGFEGSLSHSLHGEYTAFSNTVIFPSERLALLAASLESSASRADTLSINPLFRSSVSSMLSANRT